MTGEERKTEQINYFSRYVFVFVFFLTLFFPLYINKLQYVVSSGRKSTHIFCFDGSALKLCNEIHTSPRMYQLLTINLYLIYFFKDWFN